MKQVKFSTRIIIWDTNCGVSCEADPRHVEIIGQQLAPGEAKIVVTPCTKEEGRTNSDQDGPLDEEHVIKYRALVARGDYLRPGRPDIAFSVNQLARIMSSHRRGGRARFIGKPRFQQKFGLATITTMHQHIYGRRLGGVQGNQEVNYRWVNYNGQPCAERL